MKAERAVREMTSTIQPQRMRPMKRTMEPASIARAEAMTWPGTSGRATARSATMPPVSCDMTATGCDAVSIFCMCAGQKGNLHQ